MADAKITTVFRIEGQDGASAAVNSVRGSVQKLGPVLSGVGSIAASEFSKLGQGATLASGVMNLIPGQWGMIAGAAVAAGALIYKWATTTNEVLERGVAIRHAEINAIDLTTVALAKRYGVQLKLVGAEGKATSDLEKGQERLAASLKQIAILQANTNNARAAGSAEAAVALERALNAEVANGKALKRNVADLVRQKEVAEEVGKIQSKRTIEIKELETMSAAASDKASKREFDRQLRAAKAKDIEEQIVAVKQAASRADVTSEAVNMRLADLENQKVMLGAQTAKNSEKAVAARSKQVPVAKELLEAEREALEIERQMAALSAGMDAADQRAAERAQANAATAMTAQNELAAAKASAAMAGAEGGLGPIERAEIERQRIVDLDAAKATYATNEIARIAAIETANVNADAKRSASFRKEMDAAKKLADADKQRWMDRGDAALGFGALAVQGLGMAGASEKALALIKGGFAIAEGLLSFTKLYPTNPAGAYLALASGGMAAVAFGVGAFTAPSASGGGGAGGGYGSAPGAAANSSQATGPANITIVVQGGAIMGTAQQVGQYISKAVGSMAGTGMVPAAGV